MFPAPATLEHDSAEVSIVRSDTFIFTFSPLRLLFSRTGVGEEREGRLSEPTPVLRRNIYNLSRICSKD